VLAGLEETCAPELAGLRVLLRDTLTTPGTTLERVLAVVQRDGVSANHVHGFERFILQNVLSFPSTWRVECPRHIHACRRHL
jgi:hypothetical protein